MNDDAKSAMMTRLMAASEQRAKHKASLETKWGLVGHPKADKLYSLAWEMGHSAGYHEVGLYYDDMAELLK